MICPGNKIHLLIIFWNVINVTNGIPEAVEIVTPENTKTVTTTSPRESTNSPTTPSPTPPQPLTKRKPLINWATNDSYIQAYKDLHRRNPAKRNDQTYDSYDKNQSQGYNTLITSTYMNDDRYPSLTQPQPYAPMRPYPPPMTYGPPYHPPIMYHDEYPSHHMPYSSASIPFLSFLPKKISLKLILKIILKLVLFKMIVKFIAVICLLLFIPLLKSKGMDSGGEERRKMRQMDFWTNFIMDSIADKQAMYGKKEMKDIKRIMEEAENDDDDSLSGPRKVVDFLQFCVNVVDIVAGYALSYLKRQNNEDDGLIRLFLEKFHNFFERA